MIGRAIPLSRAAGLLLASCILAGCMSMPAAQYQTAVASRPLAAGAPVAVGEARAAAEVKNDRVSLRGSPMMSSASDGSFSGYIREALIAELSASGRYSASAERSIALELLRHKVDASGFSEGSAELAVRIVVSGGNGERFEKTYEAAHNWPSSFIGAVAIPAAFDNYPTAVQKLIVVVLSDPDFQAAID
jgi:hypothetical protein